MAIKTTILPEFGKFLLNVGADVPYHMLASMAKDAGWGCRLRQVSATPATNGTTLLTFMVLIYRIEEPAVEEPFDEVTFAVEPGPGPISLAARMRLDVSLIHMFFGRLPPPPVQSVQEVRAPAGDEDIKLPGEDPISEPMNGASSEADDRGFPGPVVVARHEPDGVPIFVDLYALGGSGVDTVNAVLDEIEDFLKKAQAEEQVVALALKNPELIKFVKDLGTAEQVTDLDDMIWKRRKQLEVPVMAQVPRRRSSVGAH